MESLVQVNISHNHLTGALPSTGAFLVIIETAVVGNNLCGGDFPSCKKLKNRAWWVLIACSLAALLLLAVATFGFLFINGRNNLELERAENEDRSIWELQFFDSTASKSITTDEGVVAGESNADEGWWLVEGKTVKAQIWDTAGQESKKALAAQQAAASVPQGTIINVKNLSDNGIKGGCCSS
ncbi:hypothetical protein V6N11_053834 [Hibiscus sabdariffa]|uniref:Uncharacterized protein n=1 Tax=Hibiscus sabdariffa TaxID=183260 RepID=A0ABR2S221_9ROSI